MTLCCNIFMNNTVPLYLRPTRFRWKVTTNRLTILPTRSALIRLQAAYRRGFATVFEKLPQKTKNTGAMYSVAPTRTKKKTNFASYASFEPSSGGHKKIRVQNDRGKTMKEKNKKNGEVGQTAHGTPTDPKDPRGSVEGLGRA